MNNAILNVSAWLMQAGADVNMEDSVGMTALHYASVGKSDVSYYFITCHGYLYK